MAGWGPTGDSQKDLVDTGSAGQSSLGLTPHRPVLDSEEKPLKIDCRDKGGLRPCSISKGPEEQQRHGIQSQSSFRHSLLKLGPPADSLERGGAAGPRRGTEGIHSRAVPGGMGMDQASAL